MLETAVSTVCLLAAAIAALGQPISVDLGHDHRARPGTNAGALVQRAVDPLPDPADLNGDGHVDFTDLVIVLAAWSTPGHGCDGIAGIPPLGGGSVAAGTCNGDVNGDHVVDFTDLVIVLASWTG
jgi:hypothetical protein